MTSSNPAIRAVDLTKIYRLYERQRYRLLDVFGLLPSGSRAFREHKALDGLTVSIARGEKVAVIGRNGAGKSTFMRLVSGVIQPTSGEIHVAGRIHALLQIGTGFHPDFTGRQNVFAYLAQIGIDGVEAKRLFEEIVEFAEIEEYIDQPVKTYSTGMAVRLMFSTSTAIRPDLLLLDEVLGVGDAYFTQKSFDRISALCRTEGTTLLLVTHDLYSAVRLCERVVWIDRGRVLIDGPAADVIRAYEHSIRLQEEARLREMKRRRLAAPAGSARGAFVIVELRPADGGFLEDAVHISRLELRRAGVVIGSVPLDEAAFDASRGSHLQREASAWGSVETWRGRQARAFQPFGSPFRKVTGIIMLPPGDDADLTGLTLVIDGASERSAVLAVDAFVDDRQLSFGKVVLAAGDWRQYELKVDGSPGAAAATSSRLHGTGAITVSDVRLVSARGDDVHAVVHGEPLDIVLSYQVNDPDLYERAQVLIVVHRDGVQDVCRVVTDDFVFSGAMRGGSIGVHFDRLPLANGRYTLTVMVAREGYFDGPPSEYFSLNPRVYTCLSQVLEFIVEGGGTVGTGTGVVLDGRWSMTPQAIASQAARE